MPKRVFFFTLEDYGVFGHDQIEEPLLVIFYNKKHGLLCLNNYTEVLSSSVIKGIEKEIQDSELPEQSDKNVEIFGGAIAHELIKSLLAELNNSSKINLPECIAMAKTSKYN
jgi:hypothetical protein